MKLRKYSLMVLIILYILSSEKTNNLSTHPSRRIIHAEKPDSNLGIKTGVTTPQSHSWASYPILSKLGFCCGRQYDHIPEHFVHDWCVHMGKLPFMGERPGRRKRSHRREGCRVGCHHNHCMYCISSLGLIAWGTPLHSCIFLLYKLAKNNINPGTHKNLFKVLCICH